MAEATAKATKKAAEATAKAAQKATELMKTKTNSLKATPETAAVRIITLLGTMRFSGMESLTYKHMP